MIDENEIGDEGAEGIASKLQHNRTLTTLRLGNFIDKGSWK